MSGIYFIVTGRDKCRYFSDEILHYTYNIISGTFISVAYNEELIHAIKTEPTLSIVLRTFNCNQIRLTVRRDIYVIYLINCRQIHQSGEEFERTVTDLTGGE